MQKSTRYALGCLALIASPFLYVLVSASWLGLSADWTFSPWRWRVARDAGRLSMARDYLATHGPLGRTRAQIVADLGDPHGTYDIWSYAVSNVGLGLPDDRGPPPRFSGEPTLYVQVAGDRVAKVYGTFIDEPRSGQEFNPAAWASCEFFPDQRKPMAYDLMRSKRLQSATRQEVRAALGAPQCQELAISYEVALDDSGHERRLILWFDEAGRVTRTFIQDENF